MAPTQISNRIKDIRVLIEVVRNLNYIFCNRSINKFADRMLDRTINVPFKWLLYYYKISNMHALIFLNALSLLNV